MAHLAGGALAQHGISVHVDVRVGHKRESPVLSFEGGDLQIRLHCVLWDFMFRCGSSWKNRMCLQATDNPSLAAT
jgi:hypothetical protein